LKQENEKLTEILIVFPLKTIGCFLESLINLVVFRFLFQTVRPCHKTRKNVAINLKERDTAATHGVTTGKGEG
jgi:hypothetical protein